MRYVTQGKQTHLAVGRRTWFRMVSEAREDGGVVFVMKGDN